MATTTTGHPGRTLIVLAVLIAGLITLMARGRDLGAQARSGPPRRHHHHADRAEHQRPGTVDPNSLELARTIIQNRVDSLGVGESEVTTAGRPAADRHRAERAARRAGRAGRPDRRAAVPGRVRRRAGDAAGPRPRPRPAPARARADRAGLRGAHASAAGRPATAASVVPEPQARPATTSRFPHCPRLHRSRPARPACRPTARAPRRTRRSTGSRPSRARPPSPSSPAVSRWTTSPTSRCSPATGRGPRSTCSARP